MPGGALRRSSFLPVPTGEVLLNRPEAAFCFVGSQPRPPSLGLWPIHLAHPQAGYFLLVQKVPKNTPAPFGLDPRFVQSV